MIADDEQFRVIRFPDQDEAVRHAAGQLLVDEFRQSWPSAWPTLTAASREVADALAPEKVAFAALARDGALLGWIGAQPQYEGRVWELHPIVVRSDSQGHGIGRSLVNRLEEEVRGRGALTLLVGTDDERNATTLGGLDLYPDVLRKLLEVAGSRRHPLGFYWRLGFEVVGVVPDANGFGKPDILMAKRIAAAEDRGVAGSTPA